ncbi:MAG: hypothetical protein HQM03_20960 [Magnetococcales bacterium]|nr:hypothetical protein [Magnetococcales bacterium]
MAAKAVVSQSEDEVTSIPELKKRCQEVLSCPGDKMIRLYRTPGTVAPKGFPRSARKFKDLGMVVEVFMAADVLAWIETYWEGKA